MSEASRRPSAESTPNGSNTVTSRSGTSIREETSLRSHPSISCLPLATSPTSGSSVVIPPAAGQATSGPGLMQTDLVSAAVDVWQVDLRQPPERCAELLAALDEADRSRLARLRKADLRR